MIEQDIAEVIIGQISKYITDLTNDPNSVNTTKVPGKGLGIQQPDGQVVAAHVEPPAQERDFIGITDQEGNFFYIRYRDKITKRLLSKNEKRGSCCNDAETIVPLRLVAVHTCNDARSLSLAYNTALADTDLISKDVQTSYKYPVNKPKIVLVSCEFIPWQVFTEETKQDPTTYNYAADLALISIDFDLVYNVDLHKMCINPSIC